MGIAGEQSGGLHDLSGLTVATLGHALSDPTLLDGVKGAVLSQALNGDDMSSRDLTGSRHAATLRLAVHMNRAGPAGSNTAAVLGSDEPEMVAQNPEQGIIGPGCGDSLRTAVQDYRDHVKLLASDKARPGPTSWLEPSRQNAGATRSDMAGERREPATSNRAQMDIAMTSWQGQWFG
jgi:hypothetical protein